MHRLHFTDGDGKPTPGPGRFASRWSRVEEREDGRLVHFEHFDVDDRPAMIDAGYHRETLTQVRGRLQHRRFFDTQGRRVGAVIGEWNGVHEVRYAYLKGVTPIVMEMLVDADGVPLHKRKISGLTELRVESWYPYYGTYGTYPSYGSTRVR